MGKTSARQAETAAELSNRIFFRLYQCANLMHKTGTRAVADKGVTTQQWAVLGALSREGAATGMAVGELAQYLKVSRQNLAGLLTRLEAQGYIARLSDRSDRRARSVRLTAAGRTLWDDHLTPRIFTYYEAALSGFSIDDQVETLHFFNKLLDNLVQVDEAGGE